MPKKPNITQLTLYLPKADAKALAVLSKRTLIPQQVYLREAVKAFLAKQTS